MTPGDLVGGWRLVSYHDVDADGVPNTGPLGDDPDGLLLYHASGLMSVSMMRAEPHGFMGYAGTWSLADGKVAHEVAVSSHPHMVGTRQVRDLALDGDRLTLSGVALLPGGPQRRVLSWRRTTERGPA
ncbi:lipocalin-like domain-containing protein [Actinokineospora iranica]|uniref:Lipocalin-like domain-containing protein n=1 Tax=Actinokineospora iranica TaxID=1271860 RepID=A0A1G6S5M3_9PSEU|nr:lipocalin-like domain-containing protein [Actinokineospora iranica]SDD12200.1 Lipocalin-like domain-containing protein [Actinokineospora iranica]